MDTGKALFINSDGIEVCDMADIRPMTQTIHNDRRYRLGPEIDGVRIYVPVHEFDESFLFQSLLYATIEMINSGIIKPQEARV